MYWKGPLKIIYSKVSMAGYAPDMRLLQPHQISQRSVQADLEFSGMGHLGPLLAICCVLVKLEMHVPRTLSNHQKLTK